MCITEFLGADVGNINVNKDYVFKSLSMENISSHSYMTIGLESIHSSKLMVVLCDCEGDPKPFYQKEVEELSKEALSPSFLIKEYRELISNWS